MLRCHILTSPDQKNEIFESAAQEGAQWIVNDLESKFWMQSKMRDFHKSVINGDQVLRASELWHKLLLMSDPLWQSLSPSFAQVLIEKWMKDILKEHDFNLSNKDCRKAYQTIGQILPLLSHYHGEGVMDDWFAESETAKERWYDWYQMGQILWSQFFEKKWIPEEWMKGVLINLPLEDLNLKNYVFDLGLDIDDVESELILNLSRVVDVDVVVPQTEENHEVYRTLLDRCQPNHFENIDQTPQIQYRKLPSMLSEVKEAVFQVRSWLDQGVDPSQIAIVSPAIENYWPTLNEHLLVEGIAADKAVVTPLSQLEVYQTWLSKMRMALNKVTSIDGEQVFFNQVEEPLVSYDSYKVRFTHIYDVSDFEKSETLKAELPDIKKVDEAVSFKEFLKWSFALMPQNKWGVLSERLSDFDDVFMVNESLELEKWVEFFETYLSRTEKKIKDPVPDGIGVMSLSGVLNKPVECMVLMGLSENFLTDTQSTALHWTDIESIKIKFGFNLPHVDRLKNLDKLQWVQHKQINEILLTHGETDFSGQFQAPSIYWLQGALASGHSMDLDSPGLTRWDQIMMENPSQDWQDSNGLVSNIDHLILRDKGEVEFDRVTLPYFSLSASSIEEYFKCPFRFFAQRGLHLSNLPSLDLDIDVMTRGRLIHKICELIKLENIQELSSDALAEFVERARQECDVSVYNSHIWKFLKPYYIDLTRAFLEFEKQWVQEFPNTKTWAVEKKLETRIGLDEKGLFFSPAGSIAFRGVIDRIDTNGQGQFVILDYKSSGSGLTQYSSWLKNGKLQLALYSLALIEGVLDKNGQDVVGAYYYILKSLERNKGFVTSDSDPLFLASKKMSKEVLKEFLEETKVLLTEIILKIKAGVMEPRPQDDKHCDQCDWKKLCRYPEHNL